MKKIKALFALIKGLSKLKDMNKQQFDGQIRHILSLVGGVLVALGLVDNEVVQEGTAVVVALVGAVMAVIAFVKSLKAKEKKGPVADNPR